MNVIKDILYNEYLICAIFTTSIFTVVHYTQPEKNSKDLFQLGLLTYGVQCMLIGTYFQGYEDGKDSAERDGNSL